MHARHFTMTLTIGLAVAVATGVAMAAIPGQDSVIKACYENVSGNLRVFDAEDGSPRGCGRSESLVTWNQTGPSGPRGAPGTPGEDGQDGTDGAPGISGYEVVVDESPTSYVERVVWTAQCPDGKEVIGGGAEPSLGSQPIILSRSEPLDGDPLGVADGWGATAFAPDTDFAWSLQVTVICANVAD